MRLISEGALDNGSVATLAERLGITARHLHRLFRTHLGVPPHAVAHTRRTHFAKTLIDQTSLSMAQVALGAGFGSVRRFNTAVRQVYGRSPRQLRNGREAAAGAGAGLLCLPLPYRPPFDWNTVIDYLHLRATPGVERVDSGAYRRTVAVGSVRGTIEVVPDLERSRLHVRIPVEFAGSLSLIVARVRAMFDLDADILEIGRDLGADPLLAVLVRRRPGLRVPGTWDRFELAVRAVLGQRISVVAATTLAGRLAEAYGAPVDCTTDPQLHRLFPVPEALAGNDLSGLGIAPAPAQTIRRLAEHVCDGRIDLQGSLPLEDIVRSLVRIPGIGTWTAQYVAMRGFHEPDAFPSGDLGLRRALAQGASLPSVRQVDRRSEAWRPWRAYAAVHLWIQESRSAAHETRKKVWKRRTG